MEECKYLGYEVCLNQMCDNYGELMDTDYCSRCPQFEEADA